MALIVIDVLLMLAALPITTASVEIDIDVELVDTQLSAKIPVGSMLSDIDVVDVHPATLGASLDAAVNEITTALAETDAAMGNGVLTERFNAVADELLLSVAIEGDDNGADMPPG